MRLVTDANRYRPGQELARLVMLVIPRTSILGAILLTGRLGAAAASHVRSKSPVFQPHSLACVRGNAYPAGLLPGDERVRAAISPRSAK
jgi:hypothetical protein